MSCRTLRILVVEDHVDTRVALQGYFESMDHTVSTARNVGEALGCLASTPIDFLLSDIGLPDGTGWELLERAHAPELFSVAMSGFGQASAERRSHEVGYRYHLKKPLQVEKIDEILKEVAATLNET